MYFGEDVWSTDMYGLGYTMEDDLKDSVIGGVEELYVLAAHADEYGIALSEDEKAAIETAAANFIADNSTEALKALGATEEIVEDYLSLVTIQSYMYDAIIAEADTEVSDEEANVSSYSYVTVSKTSYTDADGNTVEYTEDDLELLAKEVKAFATEAAESSLEEAAEDAGYTVQTGTFTADDTSLDADVLAALQELSEGEVSAPIELDSSYYVVRLDAKTDADATEANRQSIISQRQSDHYSEVLDAWKEESGWTLDEKVWAKVSFDNLFTTVSESTETADDTETVSQETTEQ
jgi:foldase protein PrsA